MAHLRETNRSISITGEDAVRVLREIELILISLRNIGSHYAALQADGGDADAYARETCRFVDDWRVTERLASARAILSNAFDSTLGDDDMDDLERAMESLPHWSGPGSNAPPRL